MAIRYRHEFKSENGTTWKLDIDQTGYSGSVSTFDCAKGGFEIARNSTNKNRNSPIIGSEVTVFALSQNSSFDNMIANAIVSDEETYSLVIYKNGAFWWAGVLLLDLYEEADVSYPRQINLAFSDGIGRLKSIDYNDDGATYTGTQTIIEHIWNCLGKIPSSKFWTGTDIMLKTSSVFWETQMTYSATDDPLRYIRVSHEAFYTKEQNGDIKYLSAYDVLEQCASNFFARIWLENGTFNLVQIEQFRNTTFKVFEYEKNATLYTSYSTVTPKVTVSQNLTAARLAGGSYHLYAGLKEVQINYLHNTSSNLLPSPQNINDSNVVLGNVGTNGGDARLLVNGTLNIVVENTTYSTVLVRVRMRLKQAGKYLRRDANTVSDNNKYQNVSWESSTYDVQFWTSIVPPKELSLPAEILTYDYTISFPTPYLIADGDVELELISTAAGSDFKTFQGAVVSSGVNVSGSFTGYIEYKTDSNTPEKERKFKANNDGVNFSEVLTLPTAVFGDQINSGTKSALEVNTGSAWVRSAAWKKNNAGTARNLLALLVEEVLSGQRSASKKYLGSVKGDLDFYNTLSMSSEVYMFLSGTYNAQEDKWANAEFFYLNYDNLGIALGETPLSVNASTPSSSGSFGLPLVIDGSSVISAGGLAVADDGGNTNIGSSGTPIGGTNNVNLGGGLNSGTSGIGTIAIGIGTAESNEGDYNFFAGIGAGYSNTTGGANNFLGYRAGYSNTTGFYNNFLGYLAGYSNTIGNYNNFLGYLAGYSTTTGQFNNFLGYSAGYSNVNGSHNNFLGYLAGYSNIGGLVNNFLGYQAGYLNTLGNFNNFLGYLAGYSNTTGSNNIFLGRSSGYLNTTGINNIAFGAFAAANQTTANNCIFLGESADNPSNYSHALVIGKGAIANAANSVNIGTATNNLGAVTATTAISNAIWGVWINGIYTEILVRI